MRLYEGTAAKVLAALKAYDLKEDGQGRYRANSPLRPSSNSHAFTLILHDDEYGAYFDHVSKEQGSLHCLARQLSLDIPLLPPKDTKRLYASIEDYALAHGITTETLRSAGWYETIHQNRRALGFKTITGTRWRFLDGKNRPTPVKKVTKAAGMA